MNVITLTGNSVKDIDISYSQSGTAFAKGTIAVRRDYKNQNGEYDTDFINFKGIGKLGEVIANHVKKGDKFGITGKLQIDTFEKDGKRQYYTEVVVNGFDFPTKASGQQQEKPSQRYTSDPGDPFGGAPIDDSNLPF